MTLRKYTRKRKWERRNKPYLARSISTRRKQVKAANVKRVLANRRRLMDSQRTIAMDSNHCLRSERSLIRSAWSVKG